MAERVDVFSLLPNSLLSTIVSILPFKEAVRTSVLSNSWLNACKSTRNIEFDELFFVKPYQPDEIREAQRRAFLDFTRRWINNHQGKVVDKFSLSLSMPGNAGEVIDRCLVFATKREVKELVLDFADPSWNENNVYYDDYVAMFELPAYVYGHSCLESLKLYSCSFVETEMVNFHALKQVSLGWMEVRLVAIKTLLSNCEMLESLSFKKCWNSDNFDLGEEQILGLRKLVLDRCHFRFDLFRVNAPNLKIFKYCGLMSFFIIEIHSLVMEEVDLDFSLEHGFKGHAPFLYNLVDNLCTARVLTVCSYLLQVIPSGAQLLGMERDMNVKHLILKTALHRNDFLGITFLLNSCPMLECITIELGSEKFLFGYEPPFNFNEEKFWINNVGVYNCLSSCLEVVEIKDFGGTMNELLLLNYFIICGQVLKRISINILKDGIGSSNGETMESYRRRRAEILLMVPRASPDLEISIC